MNDLLPTVPGRVEGIVCLDPLTLQCQECGTKDDPDTIGLPESARRNPSAVVVLSRIRFHSSPWSTGQTDNPRLCRDCRQARGCACQQCSDERRTR